MKYVTALYWPDGFPNEKSFGSNRFCKRARRSFSHGHISGVVPTLLSSQKVAGDDLIILLDEHIKKASPSTYESFANSELNISDLPEGVIPRTGFWLKKWHIVLHMLDKLGEPFVWVDFLDAEILEKFTDEEEAFLKNGRDIVCEFERFRVFGPKMHNSNGEVCGGHRQVQPQTCIYYLNSEKIPKLCIDEDIDHDQISLGHAMEKEYGIFQDSSFADLKHFSSHGLFRTSKNCLTNSPSNYHDQTFGCKISHKGQ